MRKYFKDHNWILSILIILIMGIGVMTLYSVTVETSQESLFRRQLLFATTALLIYFAISAINGKELKFPTISMSIYGVTLLGLILTIFLGTEARGAKRWIEIGDFYLQFGEFAKIGLILSVASLLNWQKDQEFDAPPPKNKKVPIKTRVKNYVLSSKILWAMILVIPPVALLLQQPAFGSAGLLLFTALFVGITDEDNKVKMLVYLLIGGTSLIGTSILFSQQKATLLILALALIGVAVGITLLGTLTKKLALVTGIVVLGIGLGIGVGWRLAWDNLLLPYHKERIESFLGTSEDSAFEFQTRQSMIAIGSGQMSGQGFAQGQQTRLRFLPDYHTDFIFAAFAEEFGFIGTIILFALYLALFILLVNRASKVESRFGKIVIEGTATLLLLQFFINIGMNTGLLPVLGIPLPLMSYGGSTLWTTATLLGLTQSMNLETEGTTKIAKIRGW